MAKLVDEVVVDTQIFVPGSEKKTSIFIYITSGRARETAACDLSAAWMGARYNYILML
jgi:hypothetical protein